MAESEPDFIQREPYKEYAIEVFIYRTTEDTYVPTGNVVRARKDGESRIGFSVLGQFNNKEAALRAGIAAGKARIDEGFEI